MIVKNLNQLESAIEKLGEYEVKGLRYEIGLGLSKIPKVCATMTNYFTKIKIEAPNIDAFCNELNKLGFDIKAIDPQSLTDGEKAILNLLWNNGYKYLCANSKSEGVNACKDKPIRSEHIWLSNNNKVHIAHQHFNFITWNDDPVYIPDLMEWGV